LELIKWTDDLSIGHEEIDEQHREWINIINRLNITLLDDSENPSFHKLFEDVVYYTDYHFTAEEALMEEHSYAGLENHRKLHNYFKEAILAHIQALQSGKQKDVSLVMDSLKKWLINHIRKEDMEFKESLTAS